MTGRRPKPGSPPRRAHRPKCAEARLLLLRRLLPALTALQLLLAVLLSLRGFPYFGTGQVSNAAAWELPVAAYHLPAIGLLSATGLCCGLHNGRVLGPRVVGGHIRMSGEGLLLLATVNWLAWAALLLAGWGGWRVRAERRRRASPPVEPPPPAASDA